jgi:hypothetical protein
MAATVIFALPSGSPGAAVLGFATEIKNYVAGKTGDQQVLGFFGEAGVSASIAVGSYNDSTYRTDHVGTDGGRGINTKYASSSTVQIDGATAASLPISEASGCLLISVSGIGSSVQTQNVRLYSFQMTSASGVQDLTAADNMTVYMAEINTDTAWTNASADGSNFVSFNNHTTQADRHDFYAAISVNPTTTGTKKTCGLFFSAEYF